MIPDEYLVRVGLEIEIAAFEGITWQDIAFELVESGNMLGTADVWANIHDYGCRCRNGCEHVRSGDIYVPILVSATYDASLPYEGVEFVTSTIPIVGENSLQGLRDIWQTICSKAVWRNDLEDRRGNDCSPSIHIHCSARRKSPMSYSPPMDEVYDALWRFFPELFAIASSCNIKRGVGPFRYPHPPRFRDRHSFVHIENISERILHLEWRVFEAAYHDWGYVQGCTYLAAAFTRALHNTRSRERMLSIGYAHPIVEALRDEIERMNGVNVDQILATVDDNRLAFLRAMVMEELHDDNTGRMAVANLIERIR